MAERVQRRSTKRTEWVVATVFVAITVLVLPVASFLLSGDILGPPETATTLAEGPVREIGIAYEVVAVRDIGLGSAVDEIALRPIEERSLPAETLEWFLPLEDGSVWIADRPTETVPQGRVRLFDSSGEVTEAFLLPSGAALFAPGIADDLWVGFARGETDAETIRRYSSDGALLGEYPLPPDMLVRSLSVAPTGELWAQIEEAEVDPETFESTYRSRLIPVALGEQLEPAPDPVAGAIDGNFIGADGRLYTLDQASVSPGEEGIEPTSTLVITSEGGVQERRDIESGFRPYAADASGRVYAEPFVGTREDRDVYRSTIGDAAFGAAHVLVLDEGGVSSRIQVTRPPGLSAFQPSASVLEDGRLVIMARKDASFALATMAPAGEVPAPLADADRVEPELQLIFGTEPYSGDPYRAADVAQRDLMRLVYGGLVQRDASKAPVADLATKVPVVGDGVSADGLTITYELKGDVTWHDGQPVTADDVVATWEYLSGAPTAPRGRPFAGFQYIESVENRDGRVVVALSEPFGAGPEAFFPYVLPEHLLDGDVQRDAFALGAAPVGSGPYKVMRWEDGHLWQLEAHEGSSRPTPEISQVTALFASGEDALTALQTARVPTIWTWPEPSQLSAVRRDGVGEFVRNPTGRWIGLVFNDDTPGLEQASARGVFVDAYPLEQLEAELLPVEPSDVAPSLFLGSDPVSEVAEHSVGPPPAEEIDYSSGLRFGWPEVSYEQFELVTAAWADAGLQVDRQAGVIDHYYSWYEAGELARDRHGVAAGVFEARSDPGWGGVFDPADAPAFDNSWGVGVGAPADATISRLYDQARQEYDREERELLGAEIERLLLEDSYLILERAEYRDTVVLGTIDGYEPAPYPAGDFWNIETWTLGEGGD